MLFTCLNFKLFRLDSVILMTESFFYFILRLSTRQLIHEIE